MYSRIVVKRLTILLILHLPFQPFFVVSTSSSRETSPGFDVDSILNLPMEDIFRYDDRLGSLDYHSSSIPNPTTSEPVQQHDNNMAKPILDRKAKKREYAKIKYAKEKALKPNLSKMKHQRYLARLSVMTKEEKEAIHAKKLENNRINYYKKKERIGYGRNHSLVIKQIEQKIDNGTANPEEKAKYEDFIIRKKIAITLVWYYQHLFQCFQLSSASGGSDISDDIDWDHLLSVNYEIPPSPINQNEHDQVGHTLTAHDSQTIDKKEERKRKKADSDRKYRQRPEVKARRRERKKQIDSLQQSRKQYKIRKETRGYGRIQSNIFSKLKQKVLNEQANKEEIKKYVKMKAMKSIYDQRYKQKQRMLKESKKPQ